MKNTKTLFFALAFFMAATFSAFAQIQAPAPSPAATVSQVVGFTKISIDYSSPAVKSRKIFGEIEKYGVTWRAGANGQTVIEFSTPVSVGGKNLRAGKYSIFMTPIESGDWMVHLNSKAASVFAYMKDGKTDEEAVSKDDAAAFKGMTSRGGNTERLQYHISALDNKVGMVTMAWEGVTVSFLVDTQVDQKMEGFKSVF
ncbi:MAG: hypothetical protein ACI9ZX_002236 [Algoriphagus sp.]|jgi:hypothetical protein